MSVAYVANQLWLEGRLLIYNYYIHTHDEKVRTKLIARLRISLRFPKNG